MEFYPSPLCEEAEQYTCLINTGTTLPLQSEAHTAPSKQWDLTKTTLSTSLSRCPHPGPTGAALTHGDIGQLVGGSVGVDAVQVGARDIHAPQHQGSTDVALVPGSNVCL